MRTWHTVRSAKRFGTLGSVIWPVLLLHIMLLLRVLQSMQSLQIEQFLFGLLGIDIRGRRFISNPGLFALTTLNAVLMFAALCSYAHHFLASIEQVAEPLIFIVQLCLTFGKLGSLLYRSTVLRRLIKEVDKMVTLADPSELAHWREINERQRLIAGFYGISCFNTIFLLNVFALIICIYLTVSSGTFTPNLPLQGLFPYDIHQPGYFALTYLMNLLVCFYAAIVSVGAEALFAWLVCNLAAHFRILRMKLAKLAACQAAGVDGEAHALCRHTFFYHQRLLTLCDDFRLAYRELIFVVVTLSILKVCFIFSQFVIVPKLKPYVLMFLFAVVIQLAIYCFGGEYLSSEAQTISEALYMLPDWATLGGSARFYLLPMMCSQRDIVLSGFFFPLNRPLLVWIVRTASSFLALLLVLQENAQLNA